MCLEAKQQGLLADAWYDVRVSGVKDTPKVLVWI